MFKQTLRILLARYQLYLRYNDPPYIPKGKKMRIITISCLLSVLLIGPSQLVLADESMDSAPVVVQHDIDSDKDKDEKAAKEEEKKHQEAIKKEEEERKQAVIKRYEEARNKAPETREQPSILRPSPEPIEREESVVVVTKPSAEAPVVIERNQRLDDFRRAEDERRAAIKARIEKFQASRTEKPQVITERTQTTIIRSDDDDSRKVTTRTHVITTPESRRVVVEPTRVYPPTTIVKPTAPVVTITHNANDEQRYREREMKERELRLRELELRNREVRLSAKERAYRDRQWYEERIRVRQWEDIQARDQELRYLLWRERFLTPYTWYDQGRICRYVTYYRTGVKVNKRTTICKWRNGVYSCYHPKRYYIYPVTKVVCTIPPRRSVTIIHR